MKFGVKGGVWKNTEDEILKAAVMKYGKNQWARISSLLTRKTPKQCKARWFEWLDPSINKTEWSREKDEKLLHLAKIMPTQWRTIAPIVGRTPAQCLERYQKLLDDAEAKNVLGEEFDDEKKENVRRLRPGEIDPDPETRPARPDPVHMDEDEREMLSEARARLANTQGKKAKRKAREKQLESARRLTAQQKRRELKAADIEIKENKKRRGIDYNAGIPFEHKPPEGFWNISHEIEREKKEKRSMVNVLLSKLEGQRRSEVEEEARRNDAKKIKVKMDSGDYISRSAMKALNQPDYTERGKMNLPEPQVSIDELRTIVKMSSTTTDTGDSNNVSMPTKLLLSNYDLALSSNKISGRLGSQTPITTESEIKSQARDLKAILEAETPLLGKGIETQGEVSFKNPFPRGAVLDKRQETVLCTPDINIQNTSTHTTQTRDTPLRDKIGINQLGNPDNTPVNSENFGGTDYKSTINAHTSASLISSKYAAQSLGNLPAPVNDFEIMVLNEEDEVVGDEVETKKIDDDVEVLLRKERESIEEKRKIEMELCSKTVIKGLPRPAKIDKDLILASSDTESIHGDQKFKPTNTPASSGRGRNKILAANVNLLEKNKQVTENCINNLITKTMYDLLLSDAYHYPTSYQNEVPLSSTIQSLETNDFDIEKLRSAEDLIRKEMKLMEKGCHRNIFANHDKLEEIRSDIMAKYIDNTPNNPAFIKLSDLNDKEKIKIYKNNLLYYRKLAKEGALTARKLESKLVLLNSGLQMRHKKLMDEILQCWISCENAALTKGSFIHIQNIENKNIQHRVLREKLLRLKFYTES